MKNTIFTKDENKVENNSKQINNNIHLYDKDSIPNYFDSPEGKETLHTVIFILFS